MYVFGYGKLVLFEFGSNPTSGGAVIAVFSTFRSSVVHRLLIQRRVIRIQPRRYLQRFETRYENITPSKQSKEKNPNNFHV